MRASVIPRISASSVPITLAGQWSTTDDRRIDRLTQDAYAKGYLKPADFDGVARKMVATVVKDERITGKACAG